MSGIIAQNVLDNSGLVKAPSGGGAWNFISKQTASSSSTISFTSGIDSTYKEYLFTYNNIHPSADNPTFAFNLSSDTGSNYNVTKTTTVIRAFHNEADSSTELDYLDGLDLAQGTGVQALVENIGNGNDESVAGYLYLFNPSSTTFVKHFIWEVPSYGSSNAVNIQYGSGYANTTSAVDAIQFSMGSGNIDAGDFCLYGLST